MVMNLSGEVLSVECGEIDTCINGEALQGLGQTPSSFISLENVAENTGMDDNDGHFGSFLPNTIDATFQLIASGLVAEINACQHDSKLGQCVAFGKARCSDDNTNGSDVAICQGQAVAQPN